MPLIHHPPFWWFMLALGAGGVTVFAMLCAEKGPPVGPELYIWWWPVLSFAASIVSLWRLRALDRQSGIVEARTFHLSMSDLLASVFAAAALMAIANWLSPRDFIPTGVIVSMLASMAFVVGLLLANRKEVEHKRFFALGCVLLAYGAVAVGGMISLSIVAMLIEQSLRIVFEFWSDLITGSGRRIDSTMVAIRAGFVCLPVGWLLVRLTAQPHPDRTDPTPGGE